MNLRLLRRHGAGRIDSPGRGTAGRPDSSSASPAEPFPGARVTTISVAGRATRVLDAGDGPALACSPGIASFVWDWAPVAQCLSATHRVIAVERPADERLGTGHLDAERLDVEPLAPPHVLMPHVPMSNAPTPTGPRQRPARRPCSRTTQRTC